MRKLIPNALKGLHLDSDEEAAARHRLGLAGSSGAELTEITAAQRAMVLAPVAADLRDYVAMLEESLKAGEYVEPDQTSTVLARAGMKLSWSQMLSKALINE